jgi:HlyD family secretion protein
MNRLKLTGVVSVVAFLTACEEPPLQALGQLQSDRVELVAEVFETILSINVIEGDQLQAGNLMLQQDTSRVDIRIAEAQANLVRIEAVLAEQISGPRAETINTVKAGLNEAEIDRAFRRRDLDRLSGLRQQNLMYPVSPSWT